MFLKKTEERIFREYAIHSTAQGDRSDTKQRLITRPTLLLGGKNREVICVSHLKAPPLLIQLAAHNPLHTNTASQTGTAGKHASDHTSE